MRHQLSSIVTALEDLKSTLTVADTKMPPKKAIHREISVNVLTANVPEMFVTIASQYS